MTAKRPLPTTLPPEVEAKIRADARARPPHTPEQIKRAVQLLRVSDPKRRSTA